MQITPIDNDNNLFRVENVFSAEIVNHVLSTDWLNVPWHRQEYQENWNRRRVEVESLPWFAQWEQEMSALISDVSQAVGYNLGTYGGTAFWLDEPGFSCPLHTDGEMPGSFHLTWIGDDDQGTTFYHTKNHSDIRYQVPMVPNAGYVMINLPDNTGYRKLLWHGMLHPVQDTKFRLTSYSWLFPTAAL
jgi:hypothetical protein